MKRTLVYFLSIVFLLGAVSCGEKQTPVTDTSPVKQLNCRKNL